MVINITDSNFKEIMNAGKPVVLDFWAEWCMPCRAVAPIMDSLSEQFADQVIIGKMNVDENNDIIQEYSIRNIPTILFFKNGELVDKFVGAAQRTAYEEKINALLN